MMMMIMVMITVQSARQQCQTPSQREVLQKTGVDDDNDDNNYAVS